MNWLQNLPNDPDALAMVVGGSILLLAILVLFGVARKRKAALRAKLQSAYPPGTEPPDDLSDSDIVSEEEAPRVSASVPPPSPVTAEAFRAGLQSTRGNLISRLAGIFRQHPRVNSAVLEEIEEVLITADVGVRTTEKILHGLRERIDRGELATGDEAWTAIRTEAAQLFNGSGRRLVPEHRPTVILVVGVNGVGKTTTIGKLASYFAERDQSVLLAAGDTFRAAAVTQLEVWGRRVDCKVAKGPDKADPGSVIFDAIKSAQQEGVDWVIADTAGRLHTKVPLMDELKKVGRTVEKALGRPADHVLLVLDATTGQNAIQQVELFRDALSVTGIVLTKLDGTAKGGVILGIVDQHQLPVQFVGIGERVEDLKPFEAGAFLEALFESPDTAGDADSADKLA